MRNSRAAAFRGRAAVENCQRTVRERLPAQNARIEKSLPARQIGTYALVVLDTQIAGSVRAARVGVSVVMCA
jgi:hypothetical protein